MKRVLVLVAVAALAMPTLAALLVDNGPFVTGIGDGFGGANTSAIESPGTTFGYGINVNTPLYIADDITVPAAGWQLSSMKWYSYQTGSTTTPTFTGAYVTIYNGNPVSGGTPIYGDYTANRIVPVNTTWSGAYRVTSTTLTNNQRPIMEVGIDMSWVPALAGGTYWIGVGLTGSLASGPWSVPKTPHGATDNAVQYYLGAWTALQDAGSLYPQDMPFKLDGTVLPEPTSLGLFALAGLLIRRR